MKAKTIALLFIIFILPISGLSAQGTFSFKRFFSNSNKDVLNAIVSYEKFQFSKVRIKGRKIKGKRIHLMCSRYKDGIQVDRDTILVFNSRRKKRYKQKISLYCKVTKDTSIVFAAKTNRYTYSFSRKKTVSDRYVLKAITNSKQLNARTSQNEYPIFSFTLPYEDPERPGYMLYCAIQGMEVPVEKWGTELKIPDYYIFSIVVEE